MDTKKTGTLIAEARKAKKMTQSELAALLHISDRTVSKWERGAGFPDVALLEPLADALELSVIALLHGEVSPADAADELSVREAVRIVAAESRRAFLRFTKRLAALFLLLLLLWRGYEFLSTNGDGFDHGINERNSRIWTENACREISSRGVYRIEISAPGRGVPDRRTVLADEREIEAFLDVFTRIELGRVYRDWDAGSLSRSVTFYTSGHTYDGEFVDTEDSRTILTFPALGLTSGHLEPGLDSEAEFFYHAKIDGTAAWDALEAALINMGYP